MSPALPQTSASRAAPLWPIFLIAAGLALYGLLCAALHDLSGPDESRYVLVGRELLTRDNWMLLTVNGMPYSEKPPLPFWILAWMLRLCDGQVVATVLRLPSILAGALTVVLTGLIGRRIGGPRLGMLAAGILAATPVLLEELATAKLDVPFAFWITLALAAWLLRPDRDAPLSWPRAAWFWGALAGMFFTKGPPGFLIVFGVLGAEAWAARSWRPFQRTRLLIGAPLLAMLIAGWLWAQKSAAGSAFVSEQVYDQTWQRFFHGDHGQPVYYYLPRLFTSLFTPWAFVFIPLAPLIWRRRRTLPREVVSLLGWTLLPLILFSLAHGKRQSYLLPLAPGVALLVAWYLEGRILAGARTARLARFSEWLFAVLAAVLPIALIAGFVMHERLAAESFVLTTPLALLGLAAAAGLAGAARAAWRSGGAQPRLAWAWVGAVAMVYLILQGVVPGARNPRTSAREFGRQMTAYLAARGEREVGGVGAGQRPDYHVYGDYWVLPLDNADGMLRAGQRLPEVLVGREGDWDDAAMPALMNGYVPVWRDEVDQDALIVYARVRPPRR